MLPRGEGPQKKEEDRGCKKVFRGMTKMVVDGRVDGRVEYKVSISFKCHKSKCQS